jgi:hypothetical protein
MSEKQSSVSPKPVSGSTEATTANADAKKVADHGKAEIQAAWDEANEQGYWGSVPDETPNEAYTVAGVTKAAKESK